MSKSDYPILCGGTFLSLLLEARKHRTSKRDNADGKTDGLSQTELLTELVKIIKLSFNPPVKVSTLKKNVGGYRQCDDNGGTYFAAVFESAHDRCQFDARMNDEYGAVLALMTALVNRFIGEDKVEWLVKVLIEVITKDESILNGQIFNMSGSAVTANELQSIDNVCLPAFLLAVWHYIVMKAKENTEGQATFKKWHSKKGETNSEWIFNSSIGSGIKRTIHVLPFSDALPDTEHEEHFNSAEEPPPEQEAPYVFVETNPPPSEALNRIEITQNIGRIESGGLNIGFVGKLVQK